MIARLRQEGCLKARLPLREDPEWAEAVLLNSSGGVADGDVLDCEITAQDGARVTVSMQAAERIYRALAASPARLRTRIVVAPGACMEWLPQETILFDGAVLDRALAIELDPAGTFLGVESLVFGRGAMGEQVRRGLLADRILLRRDGRLILRDAIRLSGDMAALLERRATGGGARAVATLIFAAPDPAAHLEDLRAAIASVESGASCWDGMLVARLASHDPALLRRAVVAGLAVLRGGRSLPRVWHC